MRSLWNLLAVVLLLLGMTGCDPCRDLDARMAPPLPSTPTPHQMVLSISGIGLSARLGDAFPEGKATRDGTTVLWDTLATKFGTAGSEAMVGLRVQREGELTGGTFRFPIELTSEVRGGGFALGIEAAGDSTLTLAGGGAPGDLAPWLDSLRAGWLSELRLVTLSGWFVPGATLALVADAPTISGGVITVPIGTSLPGAALDAGQRAIRPGMADDFTLALSMPLLSSLARGGWKPVLRGGAPLPSRAAPDGWSLAPLPPVLAERGLEVPVLAKRADACVWTELAVQTRPALAAGGLGWKAPATQRVAVHGEVTEDAALARAGLDLLALPVARLPLLGPGDLPSEARIVRFQGNSLLLDGVLGPIRAPRKGPRPQLPRPGLPANP
ncbi:MAG: hypothetical protein KDA24_28535 [Deltaproteobacteria bacterium]|nr:hypothetical protein [Deltaproteobacteria bacterium]